MLIDMKRRFWHALWIVPVAMFVFLWISAGMDIRYLMRVLIHGDASTDDYRWKDSMSVSASETPVPWPESRDCSAVAAAFAKEPDVTDMGSYLRDGGALSFVVVRDGAIICEWYGNGGAKERAAAAFSVSKTVTSLLLARAVADGKIASIEDAITDHVPALEARDDRFSAVSLSALVDMRSGIAFTEEVSFPWVDQDAPAVYYASDLARTIVDRPRIEAPPGAFVYNDYAPNLIGLALERAYGSRLAPGPMQSLWSELGAEYPAAWSVDGNGFAWHESGLVVTARDLARIGLLMLEDGKVGDREVAPKAFLTRSLDPLGRQVAATFAGTELGYRNGWWIPGDHDLLAMGRHGQIMLVSPATNIVIVRMGRDGHGETNISIARRLERVAERLAR
jgi:CubicO group peptidase (beta-lactamase class C family)